MEFSLLNDRPVLVTGDKVQISLLPASVSIDGHVIDFPGEYEKSGILLEVRRIQGGLVFHLKTEGTEIAYLDLEKFSPDADLISFLGDVDVLLVAGNKDTAKATESIEARVVIPYGPTASQFLATLGQNPEPLAKYKLKEADMAADATKYIALV